MRHSYAIHMPSPNKHGLFDALWNFFRLHTKTNIVGRTMQLSFQQLP